MSGHRGADEGQASTADPVDVALDMFRRGGNESYGEDITQLEHALQAAALAEAEGASPALVAAALLHDIGHLLQKQGHDAAERGIDAHHERIGAAWLARHISPAVAAPVALHVAAKRYRVATNAAYRTELSDASKLSLSLQGGPMSEAECSAFLADPAAADALRLRGWDDEAKVPGLETPPLEHFEAALRAALR